MCVTKGPERLAAQRGTSAGALDVDLPSDAGAVPRQSRPAISGAACSRPTERAGPLRSGGRAAAGRLAGRPRCAGQPGECRGAQGQVGVPCERDVMWAQVAADRVDEPAPEAPNGRLRAQAWGLAGASPDAYPGWPIAERMLWPTGPQMSAEEKIRAVSHHEQGMTHRLDSPVDGPGGDRTGGDHFEALYSGSYKEIFAYVLRHAGGDTEAVADLVAEVFVVALRKEDSIPPPPEDRLWLYGVARRMVLDHRQRRKRLLRLQSRLQQKAVIEASSDGESSRLRVQAAIDMLKPADRELLKLIAWDGLSHAEVANILGCTPNAVGQRLHKARSRLRSILTQPAPASGSFAAHPVPLSSRSQP